MNLKLFCRTTLFSTVALKDACLDVVLNNVRDCLPSRRIVSWIPRFEVNDVCRENVVDQLNANREKGVGDVDGSEPPFSNPKTSVFVGKCFRTKILQGLL